MKTCSVCKRTLPLSIFYKNMRSKDGHDWTCRECLCARQRKWRAEHQEQARASDRARWARRPKQPASSAKRLAHLHSKYGISPATKRWMFEDQHGCCAICGSQQNFESICVDHDHTTGVIRGLLCKPCNSLLGHARENIKVLEQAVAYLAPYWSKDKSTIAEALHG